MLFKAGACSGNMSEFLQTKGNAVNVSSPIGLSCWKWEACWVYIKICAKSSKTPYLLCILHTGKMLEPGVVCSKRFSTRSCRNHGAAWYLKTTWADGVMNQTEKFKKCCCCFFLYLVLIKIKTKFTRYFITIKWFFFSISFCQRDSPFMPLYSF